MITLDTYGRIRALQAQERAGESLPWIAVRDVRRMRQPACSPVACTRTSSGYAYSGGCARSKLDIRGAVRRHAAYTAVTGQVVNRHKGDRAVSVAFRFPVGAGRWFWWDDTNRRRQIRRGQAYENTDHFGLGSTGAISRYYWSCVSSPDRAFALACPADGPAVFRLRARRTSKNGPAILEIVFDFGLCRDSLKFPNRADFSFVLYECNPVWGFRSATKRYYEIYPHCFLKRVSKEGGWLPFRDASTIEGVRDFGFGYYEGGKNVAYNRKIGILSFAYNEPWTYWQNMESSRGLTHADCVKQIKANTKLDDSVMASSGGGAGRLNDKSVAALLSGVHGRDGKLFIKIMDEPWCKGFAAVLNPDPELATTRSAHVNQAQFALEQYRQALAAPSKDRHEGVYVDGSPDTYEYYLGADPLNYRREHFRTADYPLSFESATKRVGRVRMFENAKYLKCLARYMHSRNLLIMCNGPMRRQGFYNCFVDVPGTEIDRALNPIGTTPHRIWKGPYEWFPFVRAWCYHKPYVVLLNQANYRTFDVKAFFNKCALYAIYPGFFATEFKVGGEWKSGAYWGAKELYARDRRLFKTYMPIIRRLSKAGWEPLTYVRSRQRAVQIERFGKLTPRGAKYLTVYNCSRRARKVDLTFDPRMASIFLGSRRRGRPSGRPHLNITDLLHPRDRFRVRMKAGCALKIEFGPRMLRVLKIEAGKG